MANFSVSSISAALPSCSYPGLHIFLFRSGEGEGVTARVEPGPEPLPSSGGPEVSNYVPLMAPGTGIQEIQQNS